MAEKKKKSRGFAFLAKMILTSIALIVVLGITMGVALGLCRR
jgi:hypothetical protein